MPPRHLYVHVPFCARRCSYCDFSIAVRSATPDDEYLTALRAEIGGTLQKNSALSTVYLGGGTPSRLGGSGVARLIDLVRDAATIEPDAEITIEANPDDVTHEAAAAWVGAGVNRVSLGAQSFDDGALEWMHRTHDSAQIERAVRILQGAGIENLSLDLIFSLPAHLNRSWESDIEKALALDPSHISLYGLTVEQHTPIARWADRGTIVEGSEEKYEEEFLYAHKTMSAAGFEHYEVSNFARSGQASRHNSAYWTGAEYVGVGPSAHSFDGAFRRWNVPGYANWVKRLSAGESVIAGEELLTAENREAEKVYLGLRTQNGLVLGSSEVDFVGSWVREGWADLDASRLRLTATGWLRLDSLAADIAARRTNHHLALSKSA